MRYLEVRRHTIRAKPGQHLSQEGVTRARQIGSTTGPFALVVTSTLPRAYETAIAMGFAVDEMLDELCQMDEGVDAEIAWDAGFAEFARVIRQGGVTTRFAQQQAALYRSIVLRIGEGESALIVSHGGMVEAATIACLPDADHTAWGGFIDCCEGVRLQFDSEYFVAADILRLMK